MLQTARAATALPHEVAARMMPTIHRIAHQLARRLPRHVRVDDLVGAGCHGLAAALGRFDPSRGDGFESYAEFRIRGAMLDELRTCDPLSRDQRAHANQIATATRALHARLGRAPAPDEVAAELGVPLETYWERLSATTTGATTPIDDELDPSTQIHDPHAEPADERLCRKEVAGAVNEAIAVLPLRLQRILELHYVEGLTLRQIGETFGVSESRICQLRAEAIHRIRALCTVHAAGTEAAQPVRALPQPRRAPASQRHAIAA